MGDEYGPGETFVQALARGLEVICAFDGEHKVMTLSEVASRTGLSRATARRLLLTLVELGYVRMDDRRFRLGVRVLRLGTAYLGSAGLPEIAQPHLETLSERLGESTSVAVLDEQEIVYVARVATRRIMQVGISVGTRFPAYATSMGRVLLAALPVPERENILGAAPLDALTIHTLTEVDALRSVVDDVAGQGFAVVEGELDLGLRSIAVPIRRHDGATVAALNVSIGVAEESRSVEELVAELNATADALASDLELVARR